VIKRFQGKVIISHVHESTYDFKECEFEFLIAIQKALNNDFLNGIFIVI
jgi:hypothetical protein